MTRHRAPLLLLACACALPRTPGPTTNGPPAAPNAPPAAAQGTRPDYGDESPAPRSALEERALAEVLRVLKGSGGTPTPSPALDRAARAIAARAARGEPDPLARDRVQRALRAASAFDPAPRVHLSTGRPDEALAALLARLSADGATHVGIADAGDGDVRHLVLLLSRRRARLERFPSSPAPGSELRLTGELVGLLHPRIYVTRPDGSSAEVEVQGGRRFSSRITFAAPGPHAVELLGTGSAGPEVAALLLVAAGADPASPPPLPPSPAAEPEALEAAESSVVEASNRLRLAQGVARVAPSTELTAVARRHSERMLAAGTVAHVLPGSPELADRLVAARIPFRRAFENVARGESTPAAFAAIEASPAHRGNLLAPEAGRIGVGIARGTLATGERIVYLTQILIAPAEDAPEERLTADARVREELWRERERRRLPSLTNDLALEAIARQAAAAMRAEDGGEAAGLAEAALRLGRGLAAADSFVAVRPEEALRSRNLTDARFQRVGVAVVKGDSRRFGPGRLFIAVVYSD